MMSKSEGFSAFATAKVGTYRETSKLFGEEFNIICFLQKYLAKREDGLQTLPIFTRKMRQKQIP